MATVREIAFRISAQDKTAVPLTRAGRALQVLQMRLTGVDRASSRAYRSMNGMGSGLRRVLGLAAGYLTLRGLASAYQSVTEAANGQIAANQRLYTLMGNVKGATKAQAHEVMRQASALQMVTTIGDEVTSHGASQLATFQLQAKYIKQLLPSLQNLAVGTYGVNVSQEQMQQSANLMGKVFTGQVGALKRVGISFDKQQEKMLKEGTQAQKVSTIIAVMNQNYGGLAEKMAQTPEGRIVQFKNAWGDVQEELGKRVLPMSTKVLGYFARRLPYIQRITLGALDGVTNWFRENRPLFLRLWETMKRLFEAAKPWVQWLLREGFPKLLRFTTQLLDRSAKLIDWLITNWDKVKYPVYAVGGAIVAAHVAMKTFLALQGIQAAITSIKALAVYIRGVKANCDKTTASAATMWSTIAGPIGWGVALGTAGGIAITENMDRNSLRGQLQTFYPQAAIDAAARKKFKKNWNDLSTKQMTALSQEMLTPAAKEAARKLYFTGVGAGRAIAPFGGQTSISAPPGTRGHGAILAPRHARGGIVTRPHLGWVGESGPELILPLNGAGRGINISQTINVSGGGDARETARAVATATKESVKQALRELLRDERRTAYAG